MRDGIYRSLPMPRRWKVVFKMCEREAERKRYAPEAAKRAIETDFRQGLSGGYLRRLEAAVGDALRQLPGMRILPKQSDLGGSNNALERELLANSTILITIPSAASAREIVLQALSLTVDHKRNAQLRELSRHAFENGANGRAAAASLRSALAAIDPPVTAQRILEQAPALKGPLRPSVELDEALDG
ncbi:hypothetical protein HNE_0288 [Hyphomonas neptunium ATCC 15444]|uniref:Uncharacterized protein n=2 Tax=Hyphomonas TaxID=85 RepID=Q0C5H5_HYPNA|nr:MULTISPECIES: hypothetical protein [Hyphomonas]ABI76425.1 hypothetical protein HNE_0288 [Hyphomonas neptunium ATCC 15444]KCZ95452.1 hypothetical protein HHI_04830 [Hyphomonas hirschiana VP5]